MAATIKQFVEENQLNIQKLMTLILKWKLTSKNKKKRITIVVEHDMGSGSQGPDLHGSPNTYSVQ
ncbi:hypothetical protein HanIR_Chr10g0475191 [Helianthus annuus]|nr:hypothetical protein HanIR_Chr10g0475191 [Helianthus annuus]